jgi:hypothetical protein
VQYVAVCVVAPNRVTGHTQQQNTPNHNSLVCRLPASGVLPSAVVELSVSCRPLGGIAYLDTAAVAVAPSKHCPATRRFFSA